MKPVNWKPIDPESIKQYLGESQLTALCQAAPSEAPLKAVIDEVTAAVRIHVRGSQGRPLSKDSSLIPPETMGAAQYLCIEALIRRVPGMVLSPNQQRAADQSRVFLSRIAQGYLPITRPSDAQEDTASSIEVARKRWDLYTRNRLKGL